ncbi:L,D-transpeptidase family protein [Alteraurantiacibacter buctensis]|uniref:L,D-transpeptidase family protein n=1 Tax=Alteraurantiacibacter buctensis TaxID=1503981 RepID=A0A844Z203_9SPHN|nr:L,D-transpeptidase family protein [Alteraurantiacibacter buctensis]MXO73378.1 L,D-transpeptidase family protein [Alteraurantiacibacter buctensis]
MAYLRHLALALGAAIIAAPALATAQSIAYQPVLESDAVMVMAAQLPAGTARRVIPPRVAGDLSWPVEHAQQLLEVIAGIAAEGLDPADYRPDELRAALAAGEGPRLDAVAGTVFGWLAADLRDGHTPLADRRAYLMEDPDAGLLPTPELLERALASGDVAGVLRGLNPAHPDYATLRAELAATPAADTRRRALIRANMDRWRWLPRELGGINVLVNVPEYMVRLSINGQTANSYRAIVGTPGRNATPQLSEMVEGVILNPTWTVPQSIVVGEGLGRRVLANPAWARSMGYTATRSGGAISVVQQPGPRNSLGLMKLDMPNSHAIFLHDTPSRGLFNQANRALSHGCVRVERALEFAMTLSILGGGPGVEEAMAISRSGDYTRVPLPRQIPVYIAYFTLGVNDAGELVEFGDIYNRDAPVLASLARADTRQL